MNQSMIKTAVVLLSLSVLAGCASKSNSFGESLQAEGKAVADIGKKWERGQAMVKKGNKLVKKGNKQIADGEENVADGKSMVKSGQRLIEEAERAYELANQPVPDS